MLMELILQRFNWDGMKFCSTGLYSQKHSKIRHFFQIKTKNKSRWSWENRLSHVAFQKIACWSEGYSKRTWFNIHTIMV